MGQCNYQYVLNIRTFCDLKHACEQLIKLDVLSDVSEVRFPKQRKNFIGLVYSQTMSYFVKPTKEAKDFLNLDQHTDQYLQGKATRRVSTPNTRMLLTPWTAARQAPLSMGFSRQEYWSGLPCPPPGDLPDPGIEPRSPALQIDSLPSEPPGKPIDQIIGYYNFRSCLNETPFVSFFIFIVG